MPEPKCAKTLMDVLIVLSLHMSHFVDLLITDSSCQHCLFSICQMQGEHIVYFIYIILT